MASATGSAPYNWSIQAVPACFALGLVPHTFYLVRLMAATKGQISNTITNLDAWKGKIAGPVWDSLAKARGAHLNSMEVFPLFAAAMVAGNVAKLPASDMNNMALTFLGTRVLYMALYMGIKNNTLAYARTGVYFWGISIPIVGLWRAGQAVSDA